MKKLLIVYLMVLGSILLSGCGESMVVNGLTPDEYTMSPQACVNAGGTMKAINKPSCKMVGTYCIRTEPGGTALMANSVIIPDECGN